MAQTREEVMRAQEVRKRCADGIFDTESSKEEERECLRRRPLNDTHHTLGSTSHRTGSTSHKELQVRTYLLTLSTLPVLVGPG